MPRVLDWGVSVEIEVIHDCWSTRSFAGNG